MKIENKTKAVEMILTGLNILGVKDVDRANLEKAAEANEIDLTNPERIDEKAILQNRNRAGKGSILQMKKISEHPDYGRLGVNNDFGSGSPVVAYGHVPKAQCGKIANAIMPDGERYKVQYAAVEASDILTSNNVDGQTIPEYFSDDPSHIRAIAGNGRVAGITDAYRRGSADDYRNEMMKDGLHGVNPKVIEKMKAPILVRIMQPKDITADIGDRSNQQMGLTMTAVERANNDKGRIDFNRVRSYDDGSLTLETITDFVSQMPPNEQAELIDTDGNPTRQAEERAENAVFAKAYQNDGLTRLKTQALNPLAKNIIKGLTLAAPAMAKLSGLPDGYDVRDIIASAANRCVQALKRKERLDESSMQTEMFTSKEDNEAEGMIMKIFAENSRSAATIAEKLKNLAGKLVIESGMGGPDALFGADELERKSRKEIIENALRQPKAGVLEGFDQFGGGGGFTGIRAPGVDVMPGTLFHSVLDSVETPANITAPRMGAYARAMWNGRGGARAMAWLLDSVSKAERPAEFFGRLRSVSNGDY